MDRMTRPEMQRFAAMVPAILRVLEGALDSVFDEQGHRWSERKLKVAAAMSAVELGMHSKLQPRRAMWHVATVLMTLQGVSDSEGGAGGVLDSVAALAHTLSLTSLACDSEVATPETMQTARAFLEALGEEGVDWNRLINAQKAAS